MREGVGRNIQLPQGQPICPFILKTLNAYLPIDIVSIQPPTLRLETRVIIAYSFWDPRVGSITLWWGVEGESLQRLPPISFSLQDPCSRGIQR